MKVIGLMEKQMEWGDLYWQMEIFIRESGRMIKLMELVHIHILMEQGIKETG